METIPYVAHESEMARLERIIKRLWVLCIIIFLAFVTSNAAWLWYESQWQVVETTTQTIEASTEGGGNATGAIIGDGSEVNYNGPAEVDENEN